MTEENESARPQGILTEAEKEQAVKSAHRNDLRLLLGVLFVLYWRDRGAGRHLRPVAGA